MGSAKTDFIIRRRIRRQPEGCYHGHMWLGVDVGTGGSRALLVDERGRVRAGYTALHENIEMAHPQWAEQRPQNWWEAVVEAVRGVLAKAGVSGATVKGIGLSGQMHGLVIQIGRASCRERV